VFGTHHQVTEELEPITPEELAVERFPIRKSDVSWSTGWS
jgi:hypothetical protein